MTQQTDDLTEDIHAAHEEHQTRKEREEERHEKKMRELKEDRKEHFNKLRREAGLNEISELASSIDSRKGKVDELQEKIESVVASAITEVLDGSYENEITIKKGSVYRYKKQRHAHIGFVRASNHSEYRRVLDNALDRNLNKRDAGALKHLLDLVANNSSLIERNPSVEASITEIEDGSLSRRVRSYDTLRISFYRGDQQYKFKDTDSKHSRDVKIAHDTRDPDEMVFLYKVREDVISVQHRMMEHLDETVYELQDLFDRILNTIPESIDVDE